MRIEDYALIGDLHGAALVGRNGSIDWLCLPRFDSDACFAALLGDERHGRWLIAPVGGVKQTRRRYREGTLVLETEFDTDEGSVRIVDCMPVGKELTTVVRVVRGLSGTVRMRMQLVVRFDYGLTVPWVEKSGGGLTMLGGDSALYLRTPVETEGRDLTTVAEFTVREGERIPFTLDAASSHEPEPVALDAIWAIRVTEEWWRGWSGRCSYDGEWRDQVVRSLITLKALVYAPTGGIVAAPTTSLPERLGGARNWDYRYCWLRDASLTLEALMLGGYVEEAMKFRRWILRATAGHPRQAQIMYGVSGERRLPEATLDWLPGYEGSAPVRVGNAASGQRQIDVYGEIIDVVHKGRMLTGRVEEVGWSQTQVLLDFLAEIWHEPDAGIWEVRGPNRHFTHSKVMAWLAFDRGIKAAEHFGLDGAIDRWRAIRDQIHAQVCRRGFDRERNTFTQYYGGSELDASLLLIGATGFLPPDDERFVGTVEAVERELSRDGLVYRYSTENRDELDGLEGGEGAFLPCSFWLVDALAAIGRRDDARELFGRLLGLANDVGLLAEEYDPDAGRLVGNFPQAFTHLALVNSAANLGGARARPG